jgi:hypothetical protein
MAGGTPANPAQLGMRENPDGFPSSRVGFAEALRPFRCMDGLF